MTTADINEVSVIERAALTLAGLRGRGHLSIGLIVAMRRLAERGLVRQAEASTDTSFSRWYELTDAGCLALRESGGPAYVITPCRSCGEPYAVPDGMDEPTTCPSCEAHQGDES